MAFEEIDYRLEGGVARITMARPDRLNALTRRMRSELTAALARAAEEARAVLLAGAPPAFCAGQDLEEFRAETDVAGMLEREYAPLLTAVAEAPLPVVAAVGGVASGAGLHLALAADMAIAARSARFASPFAKIALTPGGGGSWLLPRRIGHARALGFALSGEAIGAETAERWGMIWRVVADDAVDEAAEALARRLAEGPTAAFALTKRLLADSWSAASLGEQMAREGPVQATAAAGADHREGVGAFLEKRKPRFTGA